MNRLFKIRSGAALLMYSSGLTFTSLFNNRGNHPIFSHRKIYCQEVSTPLYKIAAPKLELLLKYTPVPLSNSDKDLLRKLLKSSIDIQGMLFNKTDENIKASSPLLLTLMLKLADSTINR